MGNTKIGIPLEGFAEFSRIAAAEGAVLLKNEAQMLPLLNGDTVSIFGRCQLDYYRSGTGSGGAVNVAYTTNLLEGLRESERIVVNEELAGIYEAWHKENPLDNGGGGWAAEPWFQKEMPLSDELVKNAREHSTKAIVVIGRTAGEDKDNADVAGSYRLTAEEIKMLQMVCQAFSQVAVVLNVSNIIDMSWLNDTSVASHIQAVLYTWQGGIEGGRAAADVLTGRVNPSGHLTDTIAGTMADYPANPNYGSEVRNFYQEDIYVGYRYFETFAPQKVQYEFGYGLSYTSFAIAAGDASISQETDGLYLSIPVAVTNTGSTFEGKEVVQVYVEKPQGKLGKPVRELATFAKTKLLACGETQQLTFDINLYDLASYDDSGATGHSSCFVLEEGMYRFHLGNSIRQTAAVSINGKDGFCLDHLIVTEQLTQALAPKEAFTRMKPFAKTDGIHVDNADGMYDVCYEDVPLSNVSMAKRINSNLPASLPQTGNKGILLADVKAGTATMEAFIAQLSNDELATLVRGEGMGSPKGTPGTASVFGGVGDSLLDYGIRIACTADGPSGIRMEGGLKATQLPIGTLLAATWNVPLIEALYVMEGKELARNEIDALLGPGMNLRRDPQNGRNFEYFSEDPLVTGKFAAAIIRGIMAGGANATLKHFACNSQEKARAFVDAAVSERALRELYLKGFEIAIKEGNANCIMTSYNPINGHWAASNYDLNTTILREQWGFDGIVMSDWWAKMNDPITGGEADKANTAAMIRSQNDLYMVVNNNGAEINSNDDNTLLALAAGDLTLGELQRCAMNICKFIMNAPVFSREPRPRDEVKKFLPNAAQPANGVVYQLPEQPQVLPDANSSIWLDVKEAGVYLLIVRIMSPETNLAQSTSKLLLDGEMMTLVNTNGTDGQWITQKLERIELAAGVYELSMEVVKPGMVFDWIEFRK